MPAVNLITSQISIGGKLLASLGGAVRGANLQMASLQKSAVRVNASLTGLGSGLTAKLLGAAGLYGVGSIIAKSLEVAKEELGVRAAFTNMIENQAKLQGKTVGQAKAQVEELEKCAKAMQQLSGIYQGVYLKGDTVLAQYHLTTQQILSMQKGIGELLVYQGRMGKSTEEMAGK